MSGLLNRSRSVIVLGTGTRERLTSTNTVPVYVGEAAYSTDTKAILIVDSNYYFQPVQTLDMAVMYEDSVVSNNDEIVYSF